MDSDVDKADGSSDMSDADPAEILNKIKDIDALDAELFGPKKSPLPKQDFKASSLSKEKKRVSFQDPSDSPSSKSSEPIQTASRFKAKNKPKTDDFGFDLDDPLADLLSDDDPVLSPSASAGKAKSGGKKESSADDWLFADDNADDLLDDGGNKAKEKTKREENKAKLSVDSLMKRSGSDDLLKTTSPGINKMTLDDFASRAAKMSPEKMASPYTAGPTQPTSKKEIKFDDGLGFGAYRPSLPSPADSTRRSRSRRPQSNDDDFFDFLKEDDGLKSPAEKVFSPAPKVTPSRHQSPPARPATAPDASSFTPSGSISEMRPRSSELAKTPPALSPAHEISQTVYDAPILPTPVEMKPPRDDAFSAPVPKTPPSSSIPPPRQSRRPIDSSFLASTASPLQQQPTPLLQNPEQSRPTPETRPYIPPVFQEKVSADGDEARSQSLETQLAHTKALLHNVELGYKADLEVAKTTYDGRIELLRSSFDDLKSRVDRELESVRESYSARISVLRNAMQSQIHADTSKECEHQEEIKRLRNLHLQALDECRLDADSQLTRLKEAHSSEIDAIKNSTYHARNIESMMSKVDDSTDRLRELSSKYESAYRAMTQQSETISLSNKQLISVVQNQLSQQQRSTSDAQIQMQQTASRLEGLVSEMNRKMEEQHYAMQLSHSNLQSAHAALQEERKQFMQQITLEREHLRKAHREMITIQNEIRQEAREDHSKLLRAADDVATISARFEESRIIEAEQALRRNKEHEDATNNLNNEKMELARKRAQLEANREKLSTQKQDLNSKLMQFNEEKQILQQIQHELEQREADLNSMTQKAIESETDKERVYAEAKRIEEEQSRKMTEMHNDMKELTKQRQLLAEERKSLAQERSAGGLVVMTSSPAPSPSSHITRPSSATPSITPIKQRLVIGHPGSPGQTTTTAGLVMWQHSAKKDQSFLEDEQFFLETLKNSPYRKKL